MTYPGHIENGKVVFDAPVTLPEGARVEVHALPTVPSEPQPNVAEPSHAWMLKYAGMAKDLPADASVNVDHYLYGHPKQ